MTVLISGGGIGGMIWVNKVLDSLAQQAPHDFTRIEDILTMGELESTAAAYEKTAEWMSKV
ncbi:MAG: hypothetical protein ABGW81_06600 [Paracoccaceae bacterium]